MNKKTKEVLLYVLQLAGTVVVTYAIFTFVVKPIKIDGISMMPTVHNDDFALTNVLSLKLDSIERFDIVVIESASLDKDIIKRVIGLPGEKIEYKDDQLYINGTAIAENFLDEEFMEKSKLSYNVDLFTSDFSFTIPKGEYFVMGDNRLNSADSRYYGTFTKDDMLGVGGLTIYPLSHFDWIK